MTKAKTKRPAEQGRPQRRPKKSDRSRGSGSSQNRKLQPSELWEYLADLDGRLLKRNIVAKFFVTSSGYAVTTDFPVEDVPEREEEKQVLLRLALKSIEDVVAEMASCYRLPSEWPVQFATLFERKHSKEWLTVLSDAVMADMANGQPLTLPLNVCLGGRAASVQLAEPSVVLILQLFVSLLTNSFPTSLGRVARAAGCSSLESMQAKYAEVFSEHPLPSGHWEEIGARLFDIEPS